MAIVSNTNATMLVVYPMTDIKSWEDIETASVSDKQIIKSVDNITQRFYTINVKTAMENLTQVGSLLQLAYSGSKLFPCCKFVVEILADYQGLIKNSFLASSTFVDACIQSLKYHRLALLLAEKKKFDKATEMIAKTGAMAGQMVKVSQQLVQEAQKLSDKSTKALVAATEDETMTATKRDEVLKAIRELKAKEAFLNEKTKQLNQDIEEVKQKEIQAAQEAKERRTQAVQIALVSALMKPVSEIGMAAATGGLSTVGEGVGAVAQTAGKFAEHLANDKREEKSKYESQLKDLFGKLAVEKEKLNQAKDEQTQNPIKQEIAKLGEQISFTENQMKNLKSGLKEAQDTLTTEARAIEEQEQVYFKHRAELQKERREANASLIESITRLKNSGNEKNSLDKAISSLEVTVKTLGKIKTIFENARIYWAGVEKHCSRLADTETVKSLAECAADLEDEFTNAIKESGLNWLTLGKINRTAALSMKNVNASIDQIMTNLPTSEEAILLVQDISQKMLLQIEQDQKLI